METEVEKNEETEKRISKRRSSILKLPKVRNPEETEPTDTYTDFSISKPVRRVSFASSNFVKPFVADPEKNTIWDTTYEEDAYSTQSSQEQNVNSCTSLGSKLYEVSASLHNTTKLFEQDMEYTNVFSLADKENIAQYPQRKFSLVDYAKKSSTNCNLDVRDKTTRLSQGMELTCSNLNPFLKTNENLYNGRQTELMEIPLCKEIMKIENAHTDDNMEFTPCQVPQNNLVKTKNAMTNIYQEGNQTKMTCSMDFTCQLSETSSAKISDTMQFTCQVSESNLTKTTAQTMEFTCQSIETHFKEDAMELDCQPQENDLTKNYVNVELNCQFAQNNSNLTHVEDDRDLDPEISQNCSKKPKIEFPDISQQSWTITKEAMAISRQMSMSNLIKTNDSNSSHQVSHKSLIDVSTKTVDKSKFEVSMLVTQPVIIEESETFPKKSLSAMEVDEISMDEGYTDNELAAANVETTCQNSTNSGSESNFQNSMTKRKSLELTQTPEDVYTVPNKSVETSCQIPQNILFHDDNKNNSEISVNLAASEKDITLQENSSRSPKIDGSCMDKSSVGEEPSVQNFDIYQNGSESTHIPENNHMEEPCDVKYEISRSNLSKTDDINSTLPVQQNVLTDLTFDNKNNGPKLSITNTKQEKSCSRIEIDENFVDENDHKKNLSISVFDTACQNAAENSLRKPLADVEFTNITENIGIGNEPMNISCQIPENNLTKENESCSTCELSIDVSTADASQARTVQKNATLQEKSCCSMEVDQTYVSRSLVDNLDTTRQNVMNSNNNQHVHNVEERLDVECINTVQNKVAPVILIDDTKLDSQHKPEESTSARRMTVEDNGTLQEKSYSVTKADQTSMDLSSQKVTKSNCTVRDLQFNTSVRLHQTHHDNGTYIISERNNMESDNTRNLESAKEKNIRHSIVISTEKQHSGSEKNVFNETFSKQPSVMENTDVCALQTSKTAPKNPKVSCIPVKIKSTGLNTPERKFQLDQSNLELTCTVPVINETKQLPSVGTVKPKLSVLPTLEQSFHINLTNISSVDDTQQLLQCTYSNNKSNPVSFVEENKYNCFMLSLEDTGHVSKPNLNVTGCNFDENLEIRRESPDVSMYDVPKHSKLSNINDTYVLNNKKFENVSESSYCEEDNSVGIIADDCIQTLGNEDHSLTKNAIDELNKMSDNSPPKIKTVELKKPNLKIRRISELSGLLEQIEKQRADIKNYLENFKFRPFRISEELTIWEKSSSDNSGLSMETSEDSKSCPTVQERIREHEKSCQKCWKLEKIDEDYYHFSTLFGTLVFMVRLDVESGKVIDVQTANKLKESAKPFARYVMKLFLDKFDSHFIKSAIGDRFDMLSLLDYVKMTMLRLRRFQGEFMLCDRLKMEEDFVTKFIICSVPLGTAYDILVDVSDVENLNFEKDIRIVSHVGAVNENEVMNLAKECPKGLEFFQSFTRSLDEYLNHKEKRLEKMNS